MKITINQTPLELLLKAGITNASSGARDYYLFILDNKLFDGKMLSNKKKAELANELRIPGRREEILSELVDMQLIKIGGNDDGNNVTSRTD